MGHRRIAPFSPTACVIPAYPIKGRAPCPPNGGYNHRWPVVCGTVALGISLAGAPGEPYARTRRPFSLPPNCTAARDLHGRPKMSKSRNHFSLGTTR
jgi:hypothetical protein